MEEQKDYSLKEEIIRKIASLYFLGYIPKFPGTLASLFGLLVAIITKTNTLIYFTVLTMSITLGFLVSGRVEGILNKKDPREVVIDEFCGMLLSLFLIKTTLFYIGWGFIFFRVCDIIKPYPIREAEKLKGSAGIMLDDILSGIYTNLILRLLEIVH